MARAGGGAPLAPGPRPSGRAGSRQAQAATGLFDAAESVRTGPCGAPARLVILDEGEERARLERLAGRRGIAADGDLPGFAANPFAWMACTRLVVLSSRSESFSNILAEALACGRTVVSAHRPHGPRELLADGAYGRLVPVGDAAAMASAILAALDDPADPVRQRARAACFSVETSVRGYLDVLTPLDRSPGLAA